MVDVVVRDAMEQDVPALTDLRYVKTMHQERIRDADGKTLRYLVVERKHYVLGFGCLVLGQPSNWPKMKYIPQMIDLYIHPDARGQGLGTYLIRTMEDMTFDQGFGVLIVGVDRDNNRRAYDLYLRLGYEPMHQKPVPDCWTYVDVKGKKQTRKDMIIHMRKELDMDPHLSETRLIV